MSPMALQEQDLTSAYAYYLGESGLERPRETFEKPDFEKPLTADITNASITFQKSSDGLFCPAFEPRVFFFLQNDWTNTNSVMKNRSPGWLLKEK